MDGYSGECVEPIGRVPGLMLGTVIENSDDKNKGLLKIRLSGDDGRTKNVLEGVKLLAPFAGNDYGAYSLPEVGEQVLVGFICGCLNRPVVLGSLFVTGDQMLAKSFQKKNTVKRFLTKGGTLVEFSDEKDNEKITVRTPKKLSLVFDQKAQTIVADAEGAKLTADGKKGTVSVEAKKSLTLKTGQAEFTMKSDGGIAINGNMVDVKAKSLKVKSSGTMALQGEKTDVSGSLVSVQAKGILTLKGTMTKVN